MGASSQLDVRIRVPSLPVRDTAARSRASAAHGSDVNGAPLSFLTRALRRATTNELDGFCTDFLGYFESVQYLCILPSRPSYSIS